MTSLSVRRRSLLGRGMGLGAAALALAVGGGRASAATPRRLLLLSQTGPSRPVDEAVAEHCRSRGYTVTLLEQGPPPEGLAAQADAVLLSASLRARALPDSWRDVRVPLLTWENDALDDLRMTGRRPGHDYGSIPRGHELWLVNAPHPMGAGLPAGPCAIYDAGNPAIGWGKPGLGASTIATLPGEPEKAVIFSYEAGATMDYDFLAPARRAFIGLDNDTFPALNAAGHALFDAAVDWVAARSA